MSSNQIIPVNLERKESTKSLSKLEGKGKLGNKKIVEAENQTSKGWFIVAIIIGSIVVVGVGGFGAVGLLQTHGVISLPHSMSWLTSAINAIGNTPHAWGLIAMTGGGVLIGGALIAFGAIKIHKARNKYTPPSGRPIFLTEETDKKFIEQLQAKDKPKPKKLEIDKLDTSALNKFTKTHFDNQAKNLIDQSFSVENFAEVNIKPERYTELAKMHYNSRYFSDSKKAEKNFILLRDHEGTWLVTKKITDEQETKITKALQLLGYESQSLKTVAQVNEEEAKKLIEESFSTENFKSLNTAEDEKYERLEVKEYQTWNFSSSKEEAKHFIVIKTAEGAIQYTQKITEKRKQEIIAALTLVGYNIKTSK